MAFTQTVEHVAGRNSHHQIGFFTGQPIGDVEPDGDKSALEVLFERMNADKDFDTVEIGTWALDLRRADSEEDAAEYANELLELAGKYDLQIASLAAHLQGQCLGDRASAKTIQFQGGVVVEAYQAWLNKGKRPPLDDPYRVPKDVAELSQAIAAMDLVAVGRLAEVLRKLQNREVPVSGFVGSAGAWDDIFPFPPLPKQLGDPEAGASIEIGHRADYAISVILKRFGPIWDDYVTRGVKFGLESHPGEIGAGDIVSTKRFLDATDAAGYNGTVGLNFDASHLIWQDVDPIAFIHQFIDYIWSVHHKGAQVRSKRRSAAGVHGGWTEFGEAGRYWDFVFASSDRDSTSPEEIIATLNSLGWSGAITIEGEDTQFDLIPAMIRAAKLLAAIDLPPSQGAFDKAFAKS